MATFTREKLRNIAIIAHVDHGKTTLVDALLAQSGTFRENQEIAERVMDSNDLEKERGITILAKCTAIYREDCKINIVDTPGHADFGGEVERILNMVDGVVLLVDAAEGPMPQTKFVLSKALKLGINPIVVINKIDRPDERHDDVLNEIFDLFVSLNANSKQLDFPFLYASGRNGWCVENFEDLDAQKLPKGEKNLDVLYKAIINHVPMPNISHEETGFAMLATILHKDQFFGRTLTGKVFSGVGKVNTAVKAINLSGAKVEEFRLTKLFTHLGVQKIPTDSVIAGDIVTIAGMETATVSDTICDVAVAHPIKSTPIDPPTMAISIGVNTSPLAGREGTKVTSTMIRERLFAEAEKNVAITVKDMGGEKFEVGGRGELGLGVLVETMRREGFELSISRPQVLYKMIDGQKMEPIEEVVVDVDDEYANTVIAALNLRKGEMVEMISNNNRTRLIFGVPSRGLIGYQGKFLTDTRGTGILNRVFKEYAPFKGPIDTLSNGRLISTETGKAVAYAIFKLESSGKFFVSTGDEVYAGMVVGENTRDRDLEVNIMKEKQLTNVRSSGADEAIKLTPPVRMTLEEMMAYINEDELVEVTPKSLRLRKIYLDPNERKKFSK